MTNFACPGCGMTVHLAADASVRHGPAPESEDVKAGAHDSQVCKLAQGRNGYREGLADAAREVEARGWFSAAARIRDLIR